MFIVSLFTSLSDASPYLFSVTISLLVFLPFCLPWHKKRHPIAFLASLVIPTLVCWIAIPHMISVYGALRNGEDVFASLPSAIFVGFLNAHLLVLGTLLVTAYAAFQAVNRTKWTA